MKGFTALVPLLAAGLFIPTTMAKVQFAGVNIAGCDFGCTDNGYCGGTNCPTDVGPGQMHHFFDDDGLNVFRLPVGWQYLVDYHLSGQLDPTFFADYDKLVQTCLATGAHCIIDIHNYARWDDGIVQGIIGQGGPSNEDFVSVWTQLAQTYAGQSNVIFGLMNEPYDLDIPTWADTLQAVVTAIRNTGATSQLILLPGTNKAALGGFDSSSGWALMTVQDPDGSTDKLIFDVHSYLDKDTSGGYAECEHDQTDNLGYQATWLRQNGRQAFLTETGGGNTDSCVTDMCAQLSYMNDNSDVYLGWVGWAAGNFGSDYVLSEVPDGSTDTLLVSSCIAGQFH